MIEILRQGTCGLSIHVQKYCRRQLGRLETDYPRYPSILSCDVNPKMPYYTTSYRLCHTVKPKWVSVAQTTSCCTTWGRSQVTASPGRLQHAKTWEEKLRFIRRSFSLCLVHTEDEHFRRWTTLLHQERTRSGMRIVVSTTRFFKVSAYRKRVVGAAGCMYSCIRFRLLNQCRRALQKLFRRLPRVCWTNFVFTREYLLMSRAKSSGCSYVPRLGKIC